ncbi:hypothetical protein N9K67_03235 [Opitutaceae bacterium]|nr:hypothetical protein [Opitutaceae bacterium]
MSEDKLHPLLARQLRKKLPDFDVSDPSLRDFIAAVNDAYT